VTIQDLVQKYLSEQQLTLREFADAVGVSSHATVINWRDGRSEPEPGLLIRLRKFSDWRGEFAEQVLRIMYPDN
jgi:transcriptional regulator with XRE-family HTH domain